MSYVIKSGDLYLDENGSMITDLRCAERFSSRAEATMFAETGDRVVRVKTISPKPTLRDQVAEFHAMIGEPAPDSPMTKPPTSLLAQRIGFIESEVDELEEAIERRDLVDIADALADIVYFVEGTFQRLGIDSGPILAEVHRSNMAKRGAGKDANGKWQKPNGWTQPDIAGELRKQGWRGGAK